MCYRQGGQLPDFSKNGSCQIETAVAHSRLGWASQTWCDFTHRKVIQAGDTVNRNGYTIYAM